MTILGVTPLASAQNNPLNQVFTAQQLKKDFKRLRGQLEQNQPGLYEYTPKPTMDRYLDSLYATLNKSMTSQEFFLLIKPIMMKVRNGHNGIFASAQAYTYARGKGTFLPLDVVWLKNKLYVKDVYTTKTTIPKGSELVSINGRSVQDILHALLHKYSSPDGYNETFSRLEIYREFSFNYYWFIAQPKQFKVTYKAPGQSNEKSLALPGRTYKIIRSLNKARGITSKAKMLEFKILSNQTAVLKIKSFSGDAIRKGKQKYKRFLKKTFATIAQKQIKHLILDVRNNGGGDDGYGSLLFSYLTNRPFNYYKQVITKVNQIKHPEFYSNPDEIRAANKQFPSAVKKVTEDEYHLKQNEGLGRFMPQKNTFTKNLYILINGRCFSATGEFAACAHYNKRGKFIGEEVGGNYYKNTSGEMLILELPYTKLRVIVALQQYTMDVKGYPKGQGVIPHYPVDYTIDEVLKGQDVVMQKALKLIDAQENSSKK